MAWAGGATMPTRMHLDDLVDVLAVMIARRAIMPPEAWVESLARRDADASLRELF